MSILPEQVDISTEIAGVKFKNPVIAASGTFGYGEDMKEFFDPGLLGGISTKGLSLKPRMGNRPQRIAECSAGMLNAIGLNNVGVDKFISDKMPFIRSLKDTVCIANFFGSTPGEYAELAARLSEVEGVHMLEMNISCPNVKEGGIQFGVDPKLAAEVVALSRRATRLPLIVKLSPNVTDIALMAEHVVDAGADAISLVNTFTGMAVDVNTRRPVLSNVVGGLSGPAIKPVALRMTWQVCRRVKVPVIGMGGISTPEDALEFMLVGACAVQVGTASFINPYAMPEMVDGIRAFLAERGIPSLKDWIGGLET